MIFNMDNSGKEEIESAAEETIKRTGIKGFVDKVMDLSDTELQQLDEYTVPAAISVDDEIDYRQFLSSPASGSIIKSVLNISRNAMRSKREALLTEYLTGKVMKDILLASLDDDSELLPYLIARLVIPHGEALMASNQIVQTARERSVPYIVILGEWTGFDLKAKSDVKKIFKKVIAIHSDLMWMSSLRQIKDYF